MAELIWTEFALEDLKSIHEYISIDSKIYANRFIDKLISRVDQLTENPMSGRIVPEYSVITLRELIEGNYRIIYQVNFESVAIIRVHHAARQLNLI